MKKILLFLSFLLMSIGVWGAVVKDTLTSSDFAATSTTYTNFSNVSKVSDATYAGQSAKDASGNIQLRSKNSNSGVVSTTSGGTVKSVKITVGSGSNAVDVYGSNTAYTSASDLYGSNKGTKIDSVTSTGTITFTENYTYVGIRSNNGAIYLSSIEITWETGSSPSYTISAESNNTSCGTVSLSGKVITGSPNTGYRYASPAYSVSPSGSATVAQNGNEFTVTPSANTTVTINFEAIPSHTLSSVVTPVGGGTVILGSVSVLEGSTTTATATPSDGYVFTGWSITGAILSSTTTNPTTITIGTTNATITATFSEKPECPSLGKNILFHETFGENNGDARVWNDSYSVKYGVLSVYSNIEEYIVSNVKQGKKSTGYVLSGLNQSSSDYDASIVIGPLNVENYSDLILSYWWKAGSPKGTYYSKLYYATEDNGVFTEIIGGCEGSATVFFENTFSLPESAQVSTLYLKIVWRTSNTYGIIDELKLSGKSCSEEYNILWKNNDTIYSEGNPTTRFNPCAGIEKMPDIPNKYPICSNEFIGWAENDMTGSGHTKPSKIFNTTDEFFELYSDSTGDRCFHSIFATKIDNTTHEESFTSVFTSKTWGDANSTWNSGMGGVGFDEERGIQVTTTSSGANATTFNFYADIDSIIVTYSTNLRNGEGAIEFSIGNASLSQNITNEGGTTDRVLKFVFSSSKTGKIKIKVTCTENSIYIKSITVYYNVSNCMDYISYCTDTLKSTSLWSTGSSWSFNRAPQSNERAVILQPVTVDIPHARAKEVVITQNGKLTIGANKGLEVQDTISVYDGTYRATTPNDLILESSDAGNASLIFNNSNENQATVCLYSKAKIDNGTWNWQYMGTVMDSLNALYNYYGSWIYRWDESQKWKVVPNGGTMYAWTGYCITQEKPEWYTTTGTLVKTDTVRLTVPENSNMVFANSWAAPIHISRFNEETLNIDTLNIYLFNTGSDSTGTGSVSTTNRDAGTYLVVPIKAAKYLDRDSLISSQQGFFVKTTRKGEITLIYDTLVRTNSSGNIIAGPMLAPKRKILNDEPNILKIYANGSNFGDRLTILEREDFSIGFDNGWDGDKMSFSDVAPSIYVINQDGSYDEVSAIPDYEGTVLGFKSGSDSIYTITFEYDGENEWYLNDLTTLTSTLIGSDSKYTFTHDSENDVRFIISATPYAGVATDIDKASDSENSVKYLHNGNLYIIKNNRMFNAIGNLIQ